MVGERMRHARLAAGLTLDEVVERLAELGQTITKAGLSKYELGRSVPSADFLLKLAKTLNVSSSYLLRELHVKVRWLSYRKKQALSVTRQEQIQAKIIDVVESQLWLQSRVSAEQNKPAAFPKRQTVSNLGDAESMAEKLRREWGLGTVPLESVTTIIEDRGGIVVNVADHEVAFDGVSGWVNDKIPLVVANSTVSIDRRRYDLAHELGHLLLTTGKLIETREAEKQEEAVAHRFAAAFLVPAEVARRELGLSRHTLNLLEIGLLKEKYGLSMQAWVRRAKDLGIISDAYYKTLFIEISTRGWRKVEPFKFQGQETPMKLRQLTLHAVAEGIITADKAEQICPGCTRSAPYLVEVTRRQTLLGMPYHERALALSEAAEEAANLYGTELEILDVADHSDVTH